MKNFTLKKSTQNTGETHKTTQHTPTCPTAGLSVSDTKQKSNHTMKTHLLFAEPVSQLRNNNTATGLCLTNNNTSNGNTPGIKKMQKAWLMMSLVLLMILPGMAWGQGFTQAMALGQTGNSTNKLRRLPGTIGSFTTAASIQIIY